jgi:hypothetical protein
MLDEGLSEHDKEVRQFWHEHPHVALAKRRHRLESE